MRPRAQTHRHRLRPYDDNPLILYTKRERRNDMFSEHVRPLPVGQFSPAPVDLTRRPLALVMDEIITPEQFFTSVRQSAASWTGEQRLLLAVLEDAVSNFLRYKGSCTTRGKRLFREECEWFWSHEKRYLYAFETICDYLHLDPDYLRVGLQKLRLMVNAVPWMAETGQVASYRRVEL